MTHCNTCTLSGDTKQAFVVKCRQFLHHPLDTVLQLLVPATVQSHAGSLVIARNLSRYTQYGANCTARQCTFWKHLHPVVLIYSTGSLLCTHRTAISPHNRAIYLCYMGCLHYRKICTTWGKFPVPEARGKLQDPLHFTAGFAVSQVRSRRLEASCQSSATPIVVLLNTGDGGGRMGCRGYRSARPRLGACFCERLS